MLHQIRMSNYLQKVIKQRNERERTGEVVKQRFSKLCKRAKEVHAQAFPAVTCVCVTVSMDGVDCDLHTRNDSLDGDTLAEHALVPSSSCLLTAASLLFFTPSLSFSPKWSSYGKLNSLFDATATERVSVEHREKERERERNSRWCRRETERERKSDRKCGKWTECAHVTRRVWGKKESDWISDAHEIILLRLLFFPVKSAASPTSAFVSKTKSLKQQSLPIKSYPCAHHVIT